VVILPDTSAWIEFLRATGTPAHATLRALIDESAYIAITEAVAMELLAGCRSSRELRNLHPRLFAYPMLPAEGISDYEEAAEIYRVCRSRGETIRSLVDCLIAAVAIRSDAQVLHNDADFDAIARHTELQIYPAVA
jgi:predicted nucleic acid-binding protein